MTRSRFRRSLALVVATVPLWGLLAAPAARAAEPAPLYAGDHTSIVSLRSSSYGRFDQVTSGDPGDGVLTAVGDDAQVTVVFQGAHGAAASLTIGPRAGQPLVGGPYEDAVDSATPDPDHPRLHLTGFASTGCDPAPQRFDVEELAFRPDGQIERLTIDTEQTCAQNAGVTVKTRVRFHGTDLFAPSPGPDLDGDGVDASIDNCPAQSNPSQEDADQDGIGDPCDPEPGEPTVLELQGDGPTEPLTSGGYVRVTPPDGTFAIQDDGRHVQVTVAEHGGPVWVVGIDAPVRAPGTTSTGPSSVSVRRGDTTCADVAAARSVIHDLTIGTDGAADSQVSIDLDVRCAGSDDWLHGRLRIRSAVDAAGTAPTVRRLAGADRIDTAITVARSLDGYGTDAVVLARSDGFADALAGTPLAAALHAPLLLTGPSALDPRTLAEIQRSLPAGSTVHLLGGTASLGPAVAQALAGAGYAVVRHAGDDRYATAAAIARAVEAADGGSVEHVLLATGTTFPDGLAAGAAAAAAGGVLLLTDGPALPSATRAFLTSHLAVPVTAVGGQAAAAVPTAAKVVGADRYATALALAEAFFPQDVATAGLASGVSFPDALTGGAQAARVGGPLLLTPGTAMPAGVTTLLGHHVYQRVDVYGGAAVVADAVALQLVGELAKEPRPQPIGQVDAPPPADDPPAIPTPPVTLPGLPELADPVGEVLQQLTCVGDGSVQVQYPDGVYLVDADRGCARVALRGTAMGGATYSRGGRFAVVPYVEGTGPFAPWALWKVDLVTGARQQITPAMDGLGRAEWSPDGQWIEFEAFATAPYLPNPIEPGQGHQSDDIWLVRPDGSGLHRLMAVDGWGFATWSPDSSRVVAVLRNEDHLAVADIDTGQARYYPIPQDAYLATWSPDGSQLAFNADDENGDDKYLYLMDPDTGAYRPIARDAQFPRWSPDGRWIAVSRDDHIVLLRPDGATGPTIGSYELPLNWSDDGRYLLSTGGTVFDMTTGQSRTITQPGPSGPWPEASRWIPGTHTFAVITTGTGSYTP